MTEKTQWTYHPVTGHLLSKIFAASQMTGGSATESYTYAMDGQLQTVHRQNGAVITTVYNVQNKKTDNTQNTLGGQFPMSLRSQYKCSNISIILAISIFSGCSPKTPPKKSFVDLNSEIRESVGIRAVSKGWIVSESGEEITWRNAKNPTKKLCYCSGKPAWEEDYYYSGKTFNSVDGVQEEFLTIHYDYVSRKFYLAVVTGDDSLQDKCKDVWDVESNEAFKAAEEILLIWGLNRK